MKSRSLGRTLLEEQLPGGHELDLADDPILKCKQPDQEMAIGVGGHGKAPEVRCPPRMSDHSHGTQSRGGASHRANYRMNVRTGISVGPPITRAGYVFLRRTCTHEATGSEVHEWPEGAVDQQRDPVAAAARLARGEVRGGRRRGCRRGRAGRARGRTSGAVRARDSGSDVAGRCVGVTRRIAQTPPARRTPVVAHRPCQDAAADRRSTGMSPTCRRPNGGARRRARSPPGSRARRSSHKPRGPAGTRSPARGPLRDGRHPLRCLPAKSKGLTAVLG